MLGASKATTTRAFQSLSTTTITSTGAQSYTIPAGVRYLEIEMWAGGGGGSSGREITGRGASSYRRGGGGGGGSYIKHIYYGAADMLADDTLNFTVGIGGAKGTNINDSGDNGGDTTLDTHKRSTTDITTFAVDAGGGGGGRRTTSSGGQPNSEAGTATNEGNTTNTDGVAGQVMQQTGGNATADGGDGGAGGNGGAGSDGASSSAAAVNATVPGGGGGGGMPTVNTGGSHGANGKVIVKAYG